MRISGPAAIGKTLLQLAVGFNRLVIVVLEKVYVSGGKQRLLEPGTGGGGLAQLFNGAEKAAIIVGCARNLSHQVKPLRARFAGALRHRCDNLLAFLGVPAAKQRAGQRQLNAGLLLRTDFVQQCAIFVCSVAVALAFRKQVCTRLAFCDRGRSLTQLSQFRARYIRFETCGHGVIKIAQRGGRFLILPGGFVSASQHQLCICANGLTLLFKYRHGFVPSALSEQRVGI